MLQLLISISIYQYINTFVGNINIITHLAADELQSLAVLMAEVLGPWTNASFWIAATIEMAWF